MTRVLPAAVVADLGGPLAVFRAAPRLLILDFDGTLAPLAARPGAARLGVRAGSALRGLLRQKGTTVAVLSGRPLESLRRLLPAGPILAGDHGLRVSRTGLGVPARALAPWRAGIRFRLPALRRLASAFPGALVEAKACGAALHYRGASPARVPALLKAARALFRGSGLRVLSGKKVLEFHPPLGRGKAGGLNRLVAGLAPCWRSTGACLFVGDDRTDEDAFRAARAFGPRLLTVKVGPGATAAAWRVMKRGVVDSLLAALAKTPPR